MRPSITLSSIAVEAESVVVVESRSRKLSPRLTATELPPPPPPPVPPCSPPKMLPQPAVPSRVAPARPVPPILRKSRRVILVAPGVSPVPSLTVLVFIDPPFHPTTRPAEQTRISVPRSLYGLIRSLADFDGADKRAARLPGRLASSTKLSGKSTAPAPKVSTLSRYVLFNRTVTEAMNACQGCIGFASAKRDSSLIPRLAEETPRNPR